MKKNKKITSKIVFEPLKTTPAFLLGGSPTTDFWRSRPDQERSPNTPSLWRSPTPRSSAWLSAFFLRLFPSPPSPAVLSNSGESPAILHLVGLHLQQGVAGRPLSYLAVCQPLKLHHVGVREIKPDSTATDLLHLSSLAVHRPLEPWRSCVYRRVLLELYPKPCRCLPPCQEEVTLAVKKCC